MYTVHSPGWAGSASRSRHPIRPVQTRHLLLWAGGALLACVVAFMLALLFGKVMFHDAVALELAPGSSVPLQQASASSGPAAQDPFYQQKLDAKAEELPAQF